MLIQQYSDKIKESRPELQKSRDGFHGPNRGRNHQGGNYGNQSQERNYQNRGGYGHSFPSKMEAYSPLILKTCVWLLREASHGHQLK